MRDLLVLEDGVVRAMIQDAAYRAVFPFLQKAADKLTSGGCGRCNRQRHQAEANLMTEVKQAIASMPSSKKIELKKMLQANKVRLHYRTVSGQPQRLTF